MQNAHRPLADEIVILQGHPDPGGETLCHALGRAYQRGAESAGATVKQIDVAQLEFPLLRTRADFERGVALSYADGGFPKKLLSGKSARIIVTMGMPVLAYLLVLWCPQSKES